ncbi:hypothetical protein VM1G_11529 [Cytospora mali]|uniref:Cupin type-2 domain-containing protein n=1 Tax=Cytospora mali TaxID=578113 RepID=A0A194VXV8_CYTMA|nr:hypothetical protein VM1G_11529 [Valsa mali]
MISFLARRVPRGRTSHLNIITFDDGQSTADFKAPSDRYLHRPCTGISGKKETFHVLGGTARFTLGSGGQRRHRLASAGEVAVIPRGQVHAFCNASEEAELAVEFGLDPASRETDEAYFRDVWGYRDDCTRAGAQRSLFQTLLFMHRGGLVMALPGPDIISRPPGTAVHLRGWCAHW